MRDTHTPEAVACEPANSKPRLKAFTIPGYKPHRSSVRAALKRMERSGVDYHCAFFSDWRPVSFVASPDMTPLEDGYVLYMRL